MSILVKDRAERTKWLPDLPTQEEIDDLQSMLEGMLKWLPEKRVSAKDLIEGPWMRKWGLPALEKMERSQDTNNRGI